jgi:hypothetical protein
MGEGVIGAGVSVGCGAGAVVGVGEVAQAERINEKKIKLENIFCVKILLQRKSLPSGRLIWLG